jgi:inosine-uridine nucleoside N-ribohydrolase
MTERNPTRMKDVGLDAQQAAAYIKDGKMVINHVQRIELSRDHLQIIGVYLGHQRPATRQEVKTLLDLHGQFGNANWQDVLDEGRRELAKAQESSE